MTLYLTLAHEQQIRSHGCQTYPYECCGLLLGKPLTGDDKELVEVWAVPNVWESDDEATSRRRYLIPPEAVLKGEQYARQQGLEIVGYYHSHPDHPAQPSEFDREYAWPWYSYVIVSVAQGQDQAVTSWVLDEERQFCLEPLTLSPSA